MVPLRPPKKTEILKPSNTVGSVHVELQTAYMLIFTNAVYVSGHFCFCFIQYV